MNSDRHPSVPKMENRHGDPCTDAMIGGVPFRMYEKTKGGSMKNCTDRIWTAVVIALSFMGIGGTTYAQDAPFRRATWRYGWQVAANYNSASLGYQNLHEPYPNFDKPNSETEENVNGTAFAGYGGMLFEYLSDSWWGVQFRASYDSRDALVKDIYATPNTEYDVQMRYLAIEPALRIDQHLLPNLSFTAGPLLAIKLMAEYDYRPDVDGPWTENDVKVTDCNGVSWGVTGGVAYDVKITRMSSFIVYVSPFVDYSWIAAQRKSVLTETQNSTNDIWSTQTIRFGVRMSWEFDNTAEEAGAVPYPIPVSQPTGNLVSVDMPRNHQIVTKNVTGYFPILPYVFFDRGSNAIPSRYVTLTQPEAQQFDESDLSNSLKGDMTVKETNVNQLMVVYYNVMNVYAERMRRHSDEQLVLRGSDPDQENGEVYATAVKKYLVDAYNIDESRIKIETELARKPSGSALTDPAFAGLIDDENRRVMFVFSNEDMYKPVPYTIRDISSIDNDMVFRLGKDVPFKSWSVSFIGKSETVKYGPFTTRIARINPASLMIGMEEATFNARVEITLQNGSTVGENNEFTLVKVRDVRNASRYLMVFDYNKSDPVLVYETKIRKEIAPGMATGNTVIVHGHTDIIGSEAQNQDLSQRRAEQAKRIIDDQLGKENKSVDVQAIGIGQTKMQYTFDNRNPEGRMYNRNVFVEIIQ
jgi:hypothetical protein